MSLHGEPLFEGLNFKELFGKELIVDKVFWSYDGISLLCESKTPAEVFRDSRVVYIYTIGLDTGQGTLRELTVDELSDADKLPEGEYV